MRHTGGLVISSQRRALPSSALAALTSASFSWDAALRHNLLSRQLKRLEPFAELCLADLPLHSINRTAKRQSITSFAAALFTFCVLFLLCLVSNSTLAADSNWSLDSDTELSREGYFVLSWSLGDSQAYEVQHADNRSFIGAKTYPVPANSSMTLSGFADGNYYFRAGGEDTWTETVQVTVEHHSLARALGIFCCGFILFILLIVVIFRGNRLHNVEQHTVETQANG